MTASSRKRRLTAAVGIALLLSSTSLATTATANNGRRPIQTVANQSWFVDCSAAQAGDGSSAHPFNSLTQASNASYAAGDAILFKNGVTCLGTFTTSARGTADAPVTITGYGQPGVRPILNGNGASDVVKLLNSEHIVIDGLEITNPTNPSGGGQRGIAVRLTDFGIGHGYVIRNSLIHDIVGNDNKGLEGSQGIAFQVTGSTTPTTFDDVQILNNEIRKVDRQAINIQLSSWSCRPVMTACTTNNWLGATNVVVRGNHLVDIGGDGILLNTTDGGLVERNVIEGFNTRSQAYNAGIWPFNSDNFLAQYNDVSGGVSTRDGMAYDIDGGSSGATFQYNLSHDNEGGFFLFCPIDGAVSNATVRYNVSVNDHFRGFENCRNEVTSAEVYNNTIYVGDGVSQVVINEGQAGMKNVNFRNNVIVKEGAGSISFATNPDTGYRLSNNLISANATSVPPNPGGTTAAPQFCAPGPVSTLADAAHFRVASSSPALRAGVAIASNGGRDFAGDTIGNPPTLGAFERAGC